MTRLRLGPVTLHWGSKDGGPESHVFMYGLECKRLGSVLALRFADGSREAFHTHAFDALSWVLSGRLTEYSIHHGPALQYVQTTPLPPSARPVLTARSRNHMVVSNGTSWLVSLRGPWAPTWTDTPVGGRPTTLESGRKVVS